MADVSPLRKPPIRAKKKPSPSGAGRGRVATEHAIIAAFERILTRDGARSIGINAVAKEAGVAKPLIYDYFGGLPGLIRAWNSARNAWPTAATEPPVRKASKTSKARTPKDLGSTITSIATLIKANPATLELLADELSSQPALAGHMKRARKAMWCGTGHVLNRFPELKDKDTKAMMAALFAAVLYLALRARTLPYFLDMQLDKPSDWSRLMTAVERLAERALQD